MERLHRHLDLMALVLVAALVLLVVGLDLPVPSALRIGLALVFVLMVPGAALAAALFAGRHAIDGIERLVLTLGLSIIAVPLVGLALDSTPWGIRPVSMTAGLSIVTVAAAVAAIVRREVDPASHVAGLTFDRSRWLAGSRLMFGVAASFVAVVLTAQGLRPSDAATAFYLLGPDGALEGYPTALAPGQRFEVTIGIENHDGERSTYTVAVPSLGTVVDVPILADGARWEQAVTLRAPHAVGSTSIVFELYRSGDTEPYRSVRLLVLLEASPTSGEATDAVRQQGDPTPRAP